MALIYALVDSRYPGAYRYVGKTIRTLEQRLYLHKYRASASSNLYKVRWIAKVEAEGGSITPVLLEACEAAQQDEREIYWISKCRADGHMLTNMSGGGEGGVSPNPEVIEKIRAALRGRKRPQHVVDMLRENGKRYVGAANPMYGKTHTEEAKARIVAKRVGVPLSQEHKRKLSEGGARRVLTTEQVLEIYRLATGEKLKYRAIAEMFPVTAKAVSHIVSGRRWKHLNLVAGAQNAAR